MQTTHSSADVVSECCICKNTTTPIKCQYCAGEACTTCWQTYFITDNPTILQPRCMFPNCRREFITEYLYEHHFFNKELQHRQRDILFNIDRTYYPLAQRTIELIELQKHPNTTAAESRVYDHLIHDSLMGNIDNIALLACSTKPHKCPVDNCMGWLNNDHYCVLCKNTICADCNKVRNDKHICNDVDRQTLSAIRNDAKDCPKCGIYISKIDGCNDMFCIQCKTPFKYDTGLINTARNSNPLYLDYVQRNGNGGQAQTQPQMPQCGNTTATTATELLYDTTITPQVNAFFINDMTRQINLKPIATTHTAQTQKDKTRVIDVIHAMTRFTLHLQTDLENNRELYYDPATTFWTHNPKLNGFRVNRLLGKNTEDTYKADLYMLYKTNEYIGKITQIIEMFAQCTSDILIEFYNFVIVKETTIDDVIGWELLGKIKKLAEYTNQCFMITKKMYWGLVQNMNQYKIHIALYAPIAVYNTKLHTAVIEMTLHPALLNNEAYKKHCDLMQKFKIQTNGAFNPLIYGDTS